MNWGSGSFKAKFRPVVIVVVTYAGVWLLNEGPSLRVGVKLSNVKWIEIKLPSLFLFVG